MPGRILAIEDSLTMRVVIEKALEQFGLEIETAETGVEGIESALRAPPDLLLLDYILPKGPDGREVLGVDVCRRFASDDRLRQVPVVIMSAKADDIRRQFADLKNVVAVIGKPFSANDLRHLVSRHIPSIAIAAQVPRETAVPPTDRANRVAMALFKALRDRLATLPGVIKAMPELPADQVPHWIAKRFFDKGSCDRVAVDLAPILGASAPGKTATDLSGTTTAVPPIELFEMLKRNDSTGELALDVPGISVRILFRRGHIVGLSGMDADLWIRGLGSELRAEDPQVADAVRIQRQTGKPVFATLHERGSMAAADLVRLTVRQGTRIIMQALQAGPGTFAWRDMRELPSWCLADEACIRIEQIMLERWRSVEDPGQVETVVDSLDTVFRRRTGYSDAVAGFRLSDQERFVLTLVDGRCTVGDIIRRSEMRQITVNFVLFRLVKVGLLVRSGDRGGERPVIVVHDHPIDPFADDLRDMLAGSVDVRLAEASSGTVAGGVRAVLLASTDREARRAAISAARDDGIPIVDVGGDADHGCDDHIPFPFQVGDIDRILAGRSPAGSRRPNT